MKYELLFLNEVDYGEKKGNVSLIKRKVGSPMEEYAVVRNLNIEEPMESGCQWDATLGYWRSTIGGLQKAIECFRHKTEENYITRARLEEIATKEKDYIVEVENEVCYQEVIDYFRDELDMKDYELEFFGIEVESEE